MTSSLHPFSSAFERDGLSAFRSEKSTSTRLVQQTCVVATSGYDVAMSSRSVGIRELKDHASEILNAVQNGATIRVTDRRRPIALIVPVSATIDATERLEALVRAGIIAYGGGKPRGLSNARGHSADVAGAVVEDRR